MTKSIVTANQSCVAEMCVEASGAQIEAIIAQRRRASTLQSSLIEDSPPRCVRRAVSFSRLFRRAGVRHSHGGRAGVSAIVVRLATELPGRIDVHPERGADEQQDRHRDERRVVAASTIHDVAVEDRARESPTWAIVFIRPTIAPARGPPMSRQTPNTPDCWKVIAP